MSLKFTNQEEALEQICKAVPEPLMVIDAPAGYGKTFLLQEVKRRYEETGWKCAFVDLENVRKKSAIRKEIAEQVGAPQVEEIEEIDDDLEADGILIDKLAGTENEIILLFDSEERAEPTISKWLREELILRAMKVSEKLPFRVIFAGRYVQAGTEPFSKWSGYKRIQLGPLTQAVVREVIEDAVQQNPPKARELPNEYFISWSKSIMRLTGGHPKCIQKLVTALEKSNWTLTVSSKTEERLFQEYIKKEVEELTKSFDNTVKSSLEVLSIFRQFSLDTIRDLQKKAIKDFPKDIEAFELLRKLTRIGLVAKSKSRPFYSDEIVRQFILSRMRIFEPENYQTLNRVAQEIYDAGIESLIMTVATVLVSPYVQESIYHSLQQSAQPMELATYLRKQSSALTRALGEDRDDPVCRKQLENIMMADEDIRSSLEDRDLSVQILLDLAFTPAPFETSPNEPDSSKKIKDKYKSAIVSIEDVGTGFLISFKSRIYAVTCAHVIRGLDKREEDEIMLRHFYPNIGELEAKIKWFRAPEGKEPEYWTAEQDVSILELKSSLDKKLTFLDFDISQDDQQYNWEKADCWCFGYLQETRGRGTFIEKISCENEVADGFIQLSQSGKIRVGQGVSGSPLCYDQRNQGVIVGMIQAIFGKDAAYLIPSKTIIEVLSSFYKEKKGE